MPRTFEKTTSGRTLAAEFDPAQVFDIEISGALTDLKAATRPGGLRYRRAVGLVRLHGRPLGNIELDLARGRLERHDLACNIWRQFQGSIARHLEQDGMTAPKRLDERGIPATGTPRCLIPAQKCPPASVIVATRDRPGSLRRCLESLLKLEYPRYEVVVTDNASSNRKSAECVEEMESRRGRADTSCSRITYAFEPIPGVSRARNRAICEAGGEILAFVDDDVVVDPGWLTGLVRGFHDDQNVGCVTGLVLPAEVETPAQEWFEQYGGFSRGFERRVFDMDSRPASSPLYPFNAGAFGAGASMAFLSEALKAIGGFDLALGSGSPARGGEDLDCFLRIVLSGRRLVYEPAAVSWHYHRPCYEELQRHLKGYGVGLAAVMTKYLLNPATALAVMKRLPPGALLLLSPRSEKNRLKAAGFPRSLTLAELAGIVAGPAAYVRSRRLLRPWANGSSGGVLGTGRPELAAAKRL